MTFDVRLWYNGCGMSEGAETRRCTRCDQVKPLSSYSRNSRNRDSFHTYCKQCKCDIEKERRADLKEANLCGSCTGPMDRSSGSLCQDCYNKQRVSAWRCAANKLERDRGIVSSLTNEEYAYLATLPCSDCGYKHPRENNGVDRLDSSLGYDRLNSRPLCWACNVAKSDFSLETYRINTLNRAARMSSPDYTPMPPIEWPSPSETQKPASGTQSSSGPTNIAYVTEDKDGK